MLQAITEKGELVNVRANEDGTLKIAIESGNVGTTADREVVLNSSVLTVGVTATEISIHNKKVTSIMIANYSEAADITINTGDTNLQVGANLALELPINLEIETLSITSTEDAKIQLVVKGVE